MYDYAIIGAGVAGLKLALNLSSDKYFCEKKILIIDKSSLEINDKRWCYWENGIGKYDEIVHHKWNNGKFINKNNTNIKFNLISYHYKMILGLDFFNYAKDILNKNSNITWINSEVIETIETPFFININTKNNNYKAYFCFNSIIDHTFYQKNSYLKILQHFKGYVIKFDDNIWNPDEFVMMDFTASFQNQTSFMYVLPIKPNEALVEFTLFTQQVLEDSIYDLMIKKYILEKISNQPFQIIETEKGVIPMTNFPFHKTHTNRTLKIGTAGGWVRPSTGYSFKKADFYIDQIIKNIKNKQNISTNLFNKKYYILDTILLNILKNENEKGPEIFAQMYEKNSMKLIFKFLDGTTNLWEDLKIIFSFKPFPFIKAVFRELF
jgi:lycopene beta-cyclase